MVGWITDSMDMGLSKLKEIEKDREAWRAEVHGVTKRHDLATEQQQCYRTNHVKHSGFNSSSCLLPLADFVGRYLRVAWLGGPGRAAVIRRLGLRPSEGLTRARGSLASWRWLVGGGEGRQGLNSSLQGCLSVLMTWRLTSPRLNDPRDQGRSCNVFHDLALEVNTVTPIVFSWSHSTSWDSM